MLEIYNEVITDLLNPEATNLQIREDIKRGCYVEDLSSHSVQNGERGLRAPCRRLVEAFLSSCLPACMCDAAVPA
jgi:hypothetical protein